MWIEVEFLGGNKYFVNFTNDASQKLWVYFFQNKRLGIPAFQKVSCHDGREIGRSLKCLRADNETEYTSNRLENYCLENGIRHEKTISGTHNIMVWQTKSTAIF